MNFRIKVLIIVGFLSFLSLFGQDNDFTVPAFPTPPAMETPAVTPSTAEDVVQEASKSTPEIDEPVVAPSADTKSYSEQSKAMADRGTVKEPSDGITETEVISGQEMPNELPAAAVNTGLSADVRQKVATILNTLLSDEYILYTKTLKFHWNVTGIVFHDFHAAFKEQYEKLFTIVDDIAERARALGAPALGSLQEFSTYARLKEITADKLSALEMVNQLLADHETIIRTIRAAIDETAALGDQGTSNFLQDLIIKHEKIAWMLRATLLR